MLDLLFDPSFFASVPRFVTPILLAALGGALCERAGVFNIALEGFLLAGAFAAVLGSWFAGSAYAGALAAMIGGILMGLVFAEFNLRRARRGLGVVRFSTGAMQSLRAYAWPGNVRELSNLVERMAILFPHGEVRSSDLPAKYRGAPLVGDEHGATALAMMSEEHAIAGIALQPASESERLLPEEGLDLKDHLADIEVGLIRQALDATGGVVAHAARLLHMQRTTLVEKLRKYGLQSSLAA